MTITILCLANRWNDFSISHIVYGFKLDFEHLAVPCVVVAYLLLALFEFLSLFNSFSNWFGNYMAVDAFVILIKLLVAYTHIFFY